MEFDLGADFWYTRFYERPDNIDKLKANYHEFGRRLEKGMKSLQERMEGPYNGVFMPQQINGKKILGTELWEEETVKYHDNLHYIKFSDFDLEKGSIIDRIRIDINPCFENISEGGTKLVIIPRRQAGLTKEASVLFFREAEEIAKKIIKDIYAEYINILGSFYKEETGTKLNDAGAFYELKGMIVGSESSELEEIVNGSTKFSDCFRFQRNKYVQELTSYFDDIIHEFASKDWNAKTFRWIKQDCFDPKMDESAKTILGFRGDEERGLFVGASYGDPHLSFRPTMVSITHNT
jgi:hypothetical protein